MFTFSAQQLPQVEEANDNLDMIGIQNLQIAKNQLQVNAGVSGALQVAASGFAVGGVTACGFVVGGVAGGGGPVGGGPAGAQTVNFPLVYYHNNKLYNLKV
jgi:hypothetical protein